MTFRIPFLFGSALPLALASIVPLQSPADEVRSTLDRWMETRKLISEEESKWRAERAELEQTIELLERELALLADDIELAEAEGVVAAEEMSRLNEENESLLEVTDAVELRVGQVETVLPQLFASFPEPLRDRTHALLARGEARESGATVPLAQRVQAVVGFLGESDRFQESVHVARQLIPLDGDETEVRVLYLGLGQAYYLSPAGDRAGTGRPADDGWEWTPRDDAASSIRRAFAIHDLESAPEFIRLPVIIQNR